MVQNVKEWGVTIGEGAVGIDMNQVQARKDKVVTGLTKGVEFLFKKNKIEWIKGSARIAGRGKIDVTDGDAQTLSAREIVIATGSTPRSVPGVEIDRKRIITSDEAINLREVPKSIVILGSGAVGVEFASIFRRFGSDVTIIELLPRLVPVEDEAISAELQKSFRKQGIKIHTGTKVTKAAASASGVDVEAQLPDGSVERISADYLLVATGRGPVTQGLGIEGLGFNLDRGYIAVDDLFRTGVPGILRRGRCHHVWRGRAAASSIGPRVVGGRHPDGRAHRGAGARGRSTTITCPGAPIAIRRSAASGSPRRKRRSADTTCASARSRSACSAARRWPARPKAS